MSTYTPDKWVMVELKTPKETLYKVLASWYGGFAGSNSWKLSSGVTSVNETEEAYEYTNYSGSLYVCYKGIYGMSMYTMSIYSSWADQASEGVSIRVIDEQDLKGLKFDEGNIS